MRPSHMSSFRSSVTRIALQELPDSSLVREDRRNVDAAASDGRISGENDLGMFQRPRIVRHRAGNAGRFDERSLRIGQRFD